MRESILLNVSELTPSEVKVSVGSAWAKNDFINGCRHGCINISMNINHHHCNLMHKPVIFVDAFCNFPNSLQLQFFSLSHRPRLLRRHRV